MHRSILTGALVFAFSAGGFGIALADPSTEPAAPAGVAVGANSSPAGAAVPASVAPPATAGASAAVDAPAATAAPANPRPQEAAESAAPTAGADLVMWNAAAPALEQTPAESGKPMSRLRRFASGIVNRSSAIASSLTRSAMRFIGTPYVFGGTRASGFDCSGYVQHVFAMLGVRLPRTADAQYDAGRHIAAAMEPGDLVFFHTYAPGVSHVGIYLGHDKFIHSSSSHGVAITSLHNSYWAPRYLGAKRIFGS